MPERFDERVTLPSLTQVNDLPIETVAPSFGETLKAAFAVDNTVGSLFSMESDLPDARKTSDFNVWDNLSEDEQLDEVFVNAAKYADSEIELNALRRQSERERRSRKTIQNAGWMGVTTSIAAGFFDPINLIPVGGTAFRTYKTGASILKSGLATGSVAATATAATEAALHATQLERTFGESAVNISAGMLLGGALGVGVSSLAQKQSKDLVNQIVDSMDVERKYAAGEDSVGAARATEKIEIRGKVASAVAKGLAFDPLTRSMTNAFQKTRELASRLAENPIAMDGYTGTATESRIKIHDGKYVTAIMKHLDNYSAYQKELSGSTGLGRIVNKKGLSRQEFGELVGKEMRNPKPDTHPLIKASAEAWRNDLYEPMKKLAIEQKLLPDDVSIETAAQYLNRSWNVEKLKANQDKAIDVFTRWLKDKDAAILREGDDLSDELAALNKQVDEVNASGGRASKEQLARINELEEKLARSKGVEKRDLSDAEYESIAQQIFGRIVSTPDGRLPYDWKIGEGSSLQPNFGGANKARGPLASRVFAIEDELVEDFLDNNIEELGTMYLRTIAPDIELTREFGDVEMKAALKELEEEYFLVTKGMKDGSKEKVKLKKEYDQAVVDIAGMRDRIRNVYSNFDPNSPFHRTQLAIRNLNYMRFMGGVVASSLPDVARVFMAEGFVNAFKFGFAPLAKNLKGFKMSAGEAKQYAIGTDALINGRAEIIADVGDYTKGGTKVERFLQSGSAQFSNINLMNQWTTAIKQVHAVTMQNSVIDTLLKGSGNAKFYERLARLGIDKDNAELITEQLRKHSTTIDNVRLSNAKKWDDPELEVIWGSALRKESDRVIITPGQEKPLFMSREAGKTVMQFKSFMFSATQRMLIAGLQGQEANYMGGLLMLMSIGSMSYAFKQWDAGRDIATDPTTLAIEGIDRSGALGMLMEINNTIEKMSANSIGMRPLLGASQPASRYASRSQAEAFLGPTYGSFLSTSLRVLGAASAEYDWTDSDTRALRRLLPYQNLTLIRQGFDKLEESIAE